MIVDVHLLWPWANPALSTVHKISGVTVLRARSSQTLMIASHRTLPKTKQGFGVGQIQYTPKSNSDTATAEHPRVFQAHINPTPFYAFTVYTLLTNKLNTPKYHGLGAIRVEGFHVSNICKAVQYRSNCGCLRRPFDVRKLGVAKSKLHFQLHASSND
ncbi:hypothetical protein BDY19DRAFT_1051375, partial [Irpex rosettiformis]